MSTQKSNIEKFEDFELTPENAQKVEGGKGGKVKTCMTIEVKRCLTVEGGWCPGVMRAMDGKSIQKDARGRKMLMYSSFTV